MWDCLAYAGCKLAYDVAEAGLSVLEDLVKFVIDALVDLIKVAKAAVGAAEGFLKAVQIFLSAVQWVVKKLTGLIEGIITFLSTGGFVFCVAFARSSCCPCSLVLKRGCRLSSAPGSRLTF